MDVKIEYQGDKLILPKFDCDCGIEHANPDIDIYIGQGVISNLAEYLQPRNLGKNVVVVTDNVVYNIAGKKVVSILEQEGYQVKLCLVERDESVVPDESALGEILLTLDNQTDFLISVGSGVMTDITRYVAHCSGKPFVTVGTAPSMDGYTSVVAPLTFGKLKVNKPSGYPEVLVCDLDIFSEAPYRMLLGGFGDVIGKYIAKADWILGNLVNDESICPASIEIITQAVDKCTENITEIKQSSVAGVKALIEGLILAGVTILIVGHTRPVASNEHSMAHYWEMMKLLADKEPPGHGISVGVATIYCLKFYELYLKYDMSKVSLEKALQKRMTQAEKEKLIVDTYTEKIGRALIKDNDDYYLTATEQARRFKALVDNHKSLQETLSFLPNCDEMIEQYNALGYDWHAESIGIDFEMLRTSLLYAKEYRARYTVFKSAEELGILNELVEQTLAELQGR